MNNQIYVLMHELDESKRIYIPRNTEATNNIAATIIRKIGPIKKYLVFLGEDAASEKAIRGEDSIYKVLSTTPLNKDLAELIKLKVEAESLDLKLDFSPFI